MGTRLYRSVIKRVFDILASLIGIIVILPFLLVLFPFISVSNGGPIFFTQLRPGKNGEIFRLIKLQTMNNKLDSKGKLLPDNVRLTSFGKLIRSLSLDELPQLFNVLKGDMSLVGPRPLLLEYLQLYNAHQARRLEERPGITGWAQVKGRNSLNWEEKFEYDVWYIDNLSFRLDIKIVLLSIFKVLKREGISSPGVVTMNRFTGTKEEA